jgi:hypothetical protein
MNMIAEVGENVLIKNIPTTRYNGPNHYNGEIGVVIAEDIEEDEISVLVSFDDDKTYWYAMDEFDLVDEKVTGMHADQLVGQWAIRLAPALMPDGSMNNTCTLDDGADFKGPVYIESIDCTGITVVKGAVCHLLSVSFIDDNWGQFKEEPKFNEGDRVHICGSKLALGAGKGSDNGRITSKKPDSGLLPHDSGINVEIPSGTVRRVNTDAVVAYDPDLDEYRLLWKDAGVGFSIVRDVISKFPAKVSCINMSAVDEVIARIDRELLI